MNTDQLKPNIVLIGSLFTEPVEVLVVQPMGSSVKIIAGGLQSGRDH